MIRIIFLSIALSLTLNGCNGQKNRSGETQTRISPEIDVKVHREYDDKGNLIRYDSAYSYYYSNVDGDSVLRDSIFDEFRNYFGKNYSFSDDPFFNSFFFQDSLLKYDFYRHDFFSGRYNRNLDQIDRLMKEMDSVKNLFYNDQFRNDISL